MYVSFKKVFQGQLIYWNYSLRLWDKARSSGHTEINLTPQRNSDESWFVHQKSSFPEQVQQEVKKFKKK